MDRRGAACRARASGNAGCDSITVWIFLVGARFPRPFFICRRLVVGLDMRYVSRVVGNRRSMWPVFLLVGVGFKPAPTHGHKIGLCLCGNKPQLRAIPKSYRRGGSGRPRGWRRAELKARTVWPQAIASRWREAPRGLKRGGHFPLIKNSFKIANCTF